MTPAEQIVDMTRAQDEPVGIGNAGEPDLVVAGPHRIACRLDRAAALAPVLQGGGDARLGGAVAKHPFALRMRQDLALRVDDEVVTAVRRSVGSWVRSSSSERLDRRSDPPSTPATRPSAANTGIVRMTIGSPETRDEAIRAIIGRCSRTVSLK